jgi:hypothetical protein
MDVTLGLAKNHTNLAQKSKPNQYFSLVSGTDIAIR